MKLSILVCSVHTRRNTFLPKILDQLYNQFESLSQSDQNEVEILVLMDNKQMMLGTKRNYLIDMAAGQYVIFVDDDDRVSEDYVQTLLDATKEGKDSITFFADVSLDNAESKRCIYSIRFHDNNNPGTHYERTPNHICAIKKEIAEKVLYQDVIYGEDVPYAKEIKPLIETETHIEKVLYYYDFNSQTTETQSEKARRKDRLKRLKKK